MKKLLLLAMAVVLVGCVHFDWSDRVGIYTFDQAWAEFGQPSSAAILRCGGVIVYWDIAYWDIGRGGNSKLIHPHDPSGRNPIPIWDEKHQRVLHFDNDGKLISGRSPRPNGRP